jgi:hypothetical protein
MKVIEVSARKGGVGTTTVACSLALSLSQQNPDKVLLIDASHNTEAFSVLGLSGPADGVSSSVGEHNLTVVSSPLANINYLSASQYDFVVIDAGKTSGVDNSYFGLAPFRVAVVRNSYLSLRAEATSLSPIRKEAVVSIHDSGFVLNEKDVRSVLNGHSVTVFPFDHAVARAIDAGLFPARDNLWSEWTTAFIKQHDLSPLTV